MATRKIGTGNCKGLRGDKLNACKRRNSWTKLKSNKSQPNTEMWGNEKKGGMVFVSKLKYPEGSKKWRMGGVNGRGYIGEKYSKTKPEAMSYADSYMEKH